MSRSPQKETVSVAIRGLIFDFGGVITNMRWDVARRLEEEHVLERHTLLRTLYGSEGWRAVEPGELIEENLALVRACRPPYRAGILSNADLLLEDRMRDGLGIHHLFDTVI